MRVFERLRAQNVIAAETAPPDDARRGRFAPVALALVVGVVILVFGLAGGVF
jgi:hypothetical protein